LFLKSIIFIILNYRLYFFNFFTLVVYTYILYLFSCKILIKTNFFDILTNVYINDFYLNNFYFIWTQFFILPSLLILITYTNNIIFSKHKNFYKNTIYFILIFIIFWWISEYYIINQYSFITKNIQYSFNNLLSNPLNKYHPFLFFSSYIFLYNIVINVNLFTNYRHFSKLIKLNHYIYLNILLQVNKYWPLISFSLYLGSWWALQEGSWGGWWNWDASEVFGLIILTFLLIIFHLNILLNFSLTWTIFSSYFIIITLYAYVILQLSYTLVSHNFGLSLLGYGYVNTFFFILLFLVILFILYIHHIIYNYFIFLFKTYLNIFVFIKFNNYLYQKYINSIVIIFLSINIYILSFSPIINNIFWTSLNLELFNNWFYWLDTKILLFLLFLILIIKINSLIVTITCLYNYVINTYFILFYFYKNFKLNITILLHILLIIMIFLSTQIPNSIFTNWNFINESKITWFNNYYRSSLNNNIFTENTYISSNLNILYSINNTNPNTFFQLNSNIYTQFFDLDTNTNLLKQVIFNHTYLYTFKVTIFDNSSLNVDIVIIIILLFLVYIHQVTNKIIF